MSEVGDKAKAKEKEPLQLDPKSLEAISSKEWRLSCVRSARVVSQESTAAQELLQAQAEAEVSSQVWLSKTIWYPRSTRSGVKTHGDLHM